MKPSSPRSRLDHVGLAVDDLDAAVAFVGEAFGLAVDSRVEVPEKSFTAVYLDWGGTALELVAIEGQAVPLSTSANHLAVTVEDVRATDARLQELGADSEVGVTELAGRLTSFLRVAVLGGCRLQLLEATPSPHERTA